MAHFGTIPIEWEDTYPAQMHVEHPLSVKYPFRCPFLLNKCPFALVVLDVRTNSGPTVDPRQLVVTLYYLKYKKLQFTHSNRFEWEWILKDHSYDISYHRQPFLSHYEYVQELRPVSGVSFPGVPLVCTAHSLNPCWFGRLSEQEMWTNVESTIEIFLKCWILMITIKNLLIFGLKRRLDIAQTGTVRTRFLKRNAFLKCNIILLEV